MARELRDVTTEILEWFQDGQCAWLDKLANHCLKAVQSPIEHALGAALIADLLSITTVNRTEGYFLPPNKPWDEIVVKAKTHSKKWAFASQVGIGNYRADFMLWHSDGVNEVLTVVECDGHDFHEKTREQAQRDKCRDRDMQALGFRVFRFTGAEIWADAIGSAHSVTDAMRGLMPSAEPQTGPITATHEPAEQP